MADEAEKAEAAAWVTRLGGRTPSGAEAAEFQEWLSRSPTHAVAYNEALRAWRDLAAMGQREQYQKLLGEPTLRERVVGAMRAPRWAIAVTAGVAAAAVAWVVTTSGVFFQGPQLETQVAEVRDVTLPDGSVITLGAQSQLDYEFTSQQRRATLAGGDAFFSVSKDATRPFIVTVDAVQITVVGTQFEVRRRSEGVNVAVVEGIVEVSQPATEPVRLQRGQSVVAVEHSQPTIQSVSTQDIAAWREGRLVYDNATLGDLVADANRYGTTRIIIEDPQLAKERITSSFRTTQVAGVLETLQTSLPLTVEHQADGDIVLRARR